MIPLYTYFQMNAFAEYFDSNNKYMNLLAHDKEVLKNIIKYGIELTIYLKIIIW